MTAFTCSSSSGVGLPLRFVRVRSSSTCGMSARQRSSAASSASNASAASLRASAARQRSASERAALRSITRGSLESGERGADSGAGDVCRDVGDLLLGELVRERGHRALSVRDPVESELEARRRVVEIRGRSSRSCRRPRTCGRSRSRRRRGRLPCPRPGRPPRPARCPWSSVVSVGPVVFGRRLGRVGREGARDRVRRGCRLLLAAAARSEADGDDMSVSAASTRAVRRIRFRS